MNVQKTYIFKNNKIKFKTIIFFFIQEYLNSFKFKLNVICIFKCLNNIKL